MDRRPEPPPYRGIFFDCDSTLASIEGIEALAADAPEAVRARIAELTAAAMEGRMPLEDAYGARLETIRPSRADVERIGELYVRHALPNGRELMDALHALDKAVFVVSGGLLAPVQHLAEHLGIPRKRAMAVDVHFEEDGSYAGFDSSSPLARAGGKLEVLSALRPQHGPLALVGDGATDLEAAPACARFIGFAGVEARQGVLAAADATSSQPDLASLLTLLCSPAEIARLASDPRHAALLAASERL